MVETIPFFLEGRSMLEDEDHHLLLNEQCNSGPHHSDHSSLPTALSTTYHTRGSPQGRGGRTDGRGNRGGRNGGRGGRISGSRGGHFQGGSTSYVGSNVFLASGFSGQSQNVPHGWGFGWYQLGQQVGLLPLPQPNNNLQLTWTANTQQYQRQYAPAQQPQQAYATNTQLSPPWNLFSPPATT